MLDRAFATGLSGLVGLVRLLRLIGLIGLAVGSLANERQQLAAHLLDHAAQLFQPLGIARAQHDRLAHHPRDLAPLMGKGA